METGTKYEATKHLTPREIAACIRADIKAAGIAAAVKLRKFAGGYSINVTIIATPGIEIMSGVRILRDMLGHCSGGVAFYSPEALALLERVEAIRFAYSFDGSRIEEDYHNVRFYGGADFSSDLRDASRDRVTALVTASAAPANAQSGRIGAR